MSVSDQNARLVEHVVEEPEAGRDARAAAAEQSDPHLDARLARRPQHLGDALAAHAVLGRRGVAARELGERAQQPRVGVPVRDRHAEAVGEQRLVRERAHDAAALGEPLEDVGHRRAREHEVAGLGEHLDAGACACPPRASRAPRRWRRSARASPRARDRRARPRRPTTTRSSRAGAARRAPRRARAARGRSRRARRRARSPSRTCRVTTRFALPAISGAKSSPPSSRYAWSSTTMPGQAAQIALDERRCRAPRRSGCSGCTARRAGRRRPCSRAPRARARDRRPARARAPRRRRCGWRRCTADTSAWRRARVSPRPSASWAHSASTSSQPAPTTIWRGSTST